MTIASSNRAIVAKARADWQAARGSFYDRVTDDGSVTISGHSLHSGTFSKAIFLRDRSRPFQARFSTPIVPTRWMVRAVDDEDFVHWDSRAIDCDGKPYVNIYAYFVNGVRSRGCTDNVPRHGRVRGCLEPVSASEPSAESE